MRRTTLKHVIAQRLIATCLTTQDTMLTSRQPLKPLTQCHSNQSSTCVPARRSKASWSQLATACTTKTDTSAPGKLKRTISKLRSTTFAKFPAMIQRKSCRLITPPGTRLATRARTGPSRGQNVSHPVNPISRSDVTYKILTSSEDRQPSYKIAPSRNAKHSVAIAQKEAGVTQKTYGELEDQARRMTTNAFAQEKAQQRNLSSLERFESTRQKRLETRVKRQAACQKARQIRQRALVDAAAAQKCLVESVPEMRSSPYVLAKRSEDPLLVDFTEVGSGTSDRRSKAASSNPQSLGKIWKGEEIGLNPGGAYVVIS